MVDRLFSTWRRSVGALFGIACLLVLAGCGGGSGAPNNPYEPPPPVIPPVTVLPGSISVYPGTPATVTVSGGIAPYQAFSADSTVLPVSTSIGGDTLVLAANNVTALTVVPVTVRDTRGVSTTLAVTVNPAPLLPTLITINGNVTPGCDTTANTVCSGATGTATIRVTGNGGLGIRGRAVRFDVVQGTFQIVSTSPAQPLVQTLTVSTDQNGDASVILSVPADTPTQVGILRATDVTTGQQITGTFTIQQIATGGAVLSVLPQGTTTITGPDSAHCSTGVSVNYYIFGGTPPYQVATNFPQAVSISGAPVTKSGGSFTVTTNGTCFVNLTFVITDATGRTIPGGSYPLVTNEPGANAPTPPLTPLIATPGAIAKNNCVPANTFQFIGTGGVAPYSAVVTSSTSSTTPVISPQTGMIAGQAVTVANLTSPSTTVITLLDNATPRQSSTVTIDCTGTTPPPPPSSLLVTPGNYNYTTNTCVNKTSTFTVTGGTPPYIAFVTSGQTGAVVNPSTISATGGTFVVSGLTDIAATTNITVVDAGSPNLQQVVSISCPTNGQMVVEPQAGYAYTAPACATAISNFVVTGGIAPYTIAFSVPGTQGTINPTAVTASGGGFSVTGLSNTPKVNQVTIRDSSAVPQVIVRNITCSAP